MILLTILLNLDWNRFLYGEELESFLPEVLIRSAIMFLVTIIALRLMSKRASMQGVFETVTIITLGSAAGDPMFYSKVGLLPAILVFITIIIMYRIINFFVSKSKKIEFIVEGRYAKLLHENRFAIENFKPEELRKDEIFSELRLRGITHLGQLEDAYIEPSGSVSVFFLPDEKVVYGLPVRPAMYEDQQTEIMKKGYYSCAHCAQTQIIEPVKENLCVICQKNKWVRSVNDVRVQ